jgi:hypothetical protein
MKSKFVLISLVMWFAAGAICFGEAYDGTWQLNARKSHVGRRMARNNTVMYRGAFFFREKVVIDGTDAKGNPTHNEWVGALDGRDYPVTGDPESDMRAYTRVDDHTLNFWIKKDGRLVESGKIVVSPDDNTRTVTVFLHRPHHRVVRRTSVYDRVS